MGQTLIAYLAAAVAAASHAAAPPNGATAALAARPLHGSVMLRARPDGKALVGEGSKSGTYWALDRASMQPVWQADAGPGSQADGGVNSSAYVPGPYSTYKEYNVDAFIRWYLNQLKRA